MFTGRREELKILNKSYLSKDSNFIILSGKKRIGKTELINTFTKFKPTIFYTSKDFSDNFQLLSFSKEIIASDKRFSLIDTFKNWESAFYAIGDIKHNEKLIIVIDEFRLMYKENNEIADIIYKIWNHTLSKSNIMLILITGNIKFTHELLENESIASIMDYNIDLEELQQNEVNDILTGFSEENKKTIYKMFGGYPYYLSLFSSSLSVKDNIKELILNKDGKLYNETELLLHSELRELSTYNIIILAIARGNNIYSDILTSTQIEQRKLSVYIKNLVDIDILTKAAGSRGIYHISNKFIEFWFKYCFLNISNLENRNTDAVLKIISEDYLI